MELLLKICKKQRKHNQKKKKKVQSTERRTWRFWTLSSSCPRLRRKAIDVQRSNREMRMKFTSLCCLLVLSVLLIGCAEQSVPVPTSKLVVTLPEASFPLSMERKKNTKDDYALLVSQCGNPDSLLSTENDRPAPKIPDRIARYNLVGVNVVFVPHGCEERYDTAMRLLAGDTAVARKGVNQIKACVPSKDHEWTIVGYLNASTKSPMSAAEASSALSNLKEKRMAEPIIE